MATYHQMGHDSANLLTDMHLGQYKGAILSPLNYNKDKIASQIIECQSMPSFRMIFDPQLYYPHTNRGHLPNWSYFPHDVDTADITTDTWWNGIVSNLTEACKELRPHALCSPAVVPRFFNNEYFAMLIRICEMMNNKLSGTDIIPIQTVVVGLSILAETDRAYSIASILSRTAANEIFLVLLSDIDPRKELVNPEELKGAMKLIASLEESGIKLLVGFCSSDILLWKQAGASNCASGKFFNLRRFTASRFQEPSRGGGQLPYWFEESLLAYLRESDIIRVSNAGVLSTASQCNPYSSEILDKLNNSPGEPWLSIGWRQYLYWFADIEDRINSGQINVAALLKEAEGCWIDLEEKNVLMEEMNNNGQWIRAWRRSVAEYRM